MVMTDVGTTYTSANHPVGDTIEMISDEAADVMTAYVVGIDTDGKRGYEEITMNGAATVAGTKAWNYIEEVYMESTVAGAITCQEASGDADIYARDFTTLKSLSFNTAHFFTDKDRGAWITSFGVHKLLAGVAAGNVYAEIRVFPEQAACVTPANFGYYPVCGICLPDEGVGRIDAFPQHIWVPPAAYAMVWVTGEGDNDEDIGVFLQAYEDY